MDAHTATPPVLRVQDLRVSFDSATGPVPVLHDLSFEVGRGETLGIVGESGCGKSMTALALMRLVPNPPARITGGRIVLDDEDLLTLDERSMADRRGNRVAMIFQEPMTALNPVYSVGDQIAESLRRHRGLDHKRSLAAAVDLLTAVQIPTPRQRVAEYPHQLSGGMRQRVMIAMALACKPALLIADEPTTALDVTVQAQIFDLLKDLQREHGTAMILITHDFGAVAEMADRVMVMYAGYKVEEGSVRDITRTPLHPYTQGLLQCMPDLASGVGRAREPLTEIPGGVPNLLALAPGCPFKPRCPMAGPRCNRMPPLMQAGPARAVACWAVNGSVSA